MNLPYELFIGLRYLKAKRKQTLISLITVISVAGVALGVGTLIAVLAVMTGFKEDLQEKILGTNSHVVVYERGEQGIKGYQELIKKVRKIDHVIAVSPFIMGQVMLSSGSSVSGVIIKGVDPTLVIKVTDIAKYIKEGKIESLQGTDKKPGLILGKELARRLGSFIGDEVTVLSPLGEMGPFGMIPRMKKFDVVAVFDSGMYEYDSTLVYTSIKNAQDFFDMGDSVSGLEVRVDDIYKASRITDVIEAKLNEEGLRYWARDWMQMNRSLFSALKLEKIVMFIILILIILVAAFGIVGTLTLIVMEKTKDIAILISMGVARSGIMRIFMIEGLIIGVIGTILGLILGSTIVKLLHEFITLPGDVYYISYLPVKMKGLDLILVSISGVVISFLATLYPSYQAAKLNPAEAIRYE